MWYGIQRVIAFVGLVGMSPVLFIVGWLIKKEDGGRVFFRQRRWGKGRKEFVIWKLRTMREGAEMMKKELRDLNEADGPVFKIKNDPRFTKIGKWLSRRGWDELPQLWNVVRGEMALVGPRPLPVEEAKLVPKKYWRRYEVLPGITSLWVIKGAHELSFEEWMKWDEWYVNHKSWWVDVKVLVATGLKMIRWLGVRE